jgi:hypothetical protein
MTGEGGGDFRVQQAVLSSPFAAIVSLRFCRKVCRHAFVARTAKEHLRMRKWFGLLGRGLNPVEHSIAL